MAALGSDITHRSLVSKGVDGKSPISMIVINAAIAYRGAFCTHDTTTGEVKPYDGTVTDRAVGWHFQDAVTGNSAAPRNTARIITGGYQAKRAVTGLVTTVTTDYGKKVYASNDNDLTLTGTTATMHVGFVVANSEGTTAGTNAWVAFRDMFGKVGGQ